ncbi:MAG TPA: DSD1 family PLP-dependent enzyme [Bryobacteraceae bacterium]
MTRDEIDTPALLIDLNEMESNLRQMSAFFADKPIKLRPHFKNHKSPLLAHKQLDAGAIGLTCATLREAEILANGGFRDILIANEIAGERELSQFAELSRRTDVIVALDNEQVAVEMAAVSRARGLPLSVVVDLNVGLNRCGILPGEPAFRLAKTAVELGLKFRGLMGYEGHLQAFPQSEERDKVVRQVCQSLTDSKRLIESAGIPVEIVSTGGTGTYMIGGQYPGITDIQAGSYLLMDTIYTNRGSTFKRSLTILTTVISRPDQNRAILDCGLKALSGERGLSTVKGVEGVQLKALHAVHGLLEIQNPDECLQPGRKIELWVHYSDATVNLHDRMYGVRNGNVEEIIRIEH